MKKTKFIIFTIIFVCIILSAYIIIRYVIVGPSAYKPNQAIANGDVVGLMGKTTNLDKLKDFINNVKKQKKDKVRVTTYTVEGDAIIKTLNFNGKNIECSVDSRRDKFSSHDLRKITKYTFTNIDIELNNNNTIYFLSNNNKSDRMDILHVINTSNNW